MIDRRAEIQPDNAMKWTPTGKVLIQGIDRPLGRDYARRMKAAGTAIAAGIAVGQGGDSIEEIPVFDLVAGAIEREGAIETTLLFVDAYQVLDAALEAIEAGIPQMIIVTAGVPPLDMVELLKQAQLTQTLILGPGSCGAIVPDRLWLGISEPGFYQPGSIGLITRGDRLGDDVAKTLTDGGFGQSLAVSLGTDGIIGSNIEQWLQILEEDERTEAIVLVSQIGGKAEIEAAKYIAQSIEKPVLVYIAGLHFPIESRFDDTDTIIKGALSYSVAVKPSRREIPRYFEESGVTVVEKLSELTEYLQIILS